jgi:pimeloyl-ACP methyl ester carboxylesterase
MTLGHHTIGTGPHKVIALHGWFGDETAYAPIYDALDVESFTFAFPAYRGYGASKHMSGGYSMREISADVLALADALGWKRFSLVCHSMGGMAIQRVYADAPDRVLKLVGVTPVPASGVPFDEPTWNAFSAAVHDRAAREAIIDFSTGKRHAKCWVARIASHSEATSTRQAFGAYLDAWVHSNFVGDLKVRDVPVLALVGEHDAAITPDVMKATYLATYPNAELLVMANAGHYPMNETPVALATAIQDFLRRR